MVQHTTQMKDKVCLITGATLGIGQVTAQALAAQGATVVIIARSQTKAEATVQQIKSATGNNLVSYLLADLSSLAAVRKVAQDFKSKFSRLDVFINNAGAINWGRTVTTDGFETTFGVNHLAPFVLTHELIDVIKASAPSRIINVSSSASRGGLIDFDDLQGEKKYTAMKAYSQSKLANILFSVGLAKRLQGTGVTANALHPGFVSTGFAKNNGPIFRVAMAALSIIALTPEKGAETSIYLATAPEVATITGQYFIKKQIAEPNAAAKDDATIEHLWTMSEQLTGVSW